MLRFLACALTVAVGITIVAAPGLAQTCDKVWTGNVDQFWAEDSNWSPFGQPIETDAVCHLIGGSIVFDVAGTSLQNPYVIEAFSVAELGDLTIMDDHHMRITTNLAHVTNPPGTGGYIVALEPQASLHVLGNVEGLTLQGLGDLNEDEPLHVTVDGNVVSPYVTMTQSVLGTIAGRVDLVGADPILEMIGYGDPVTEVGPTVTIGSGLPPGSDAVVGGHIDLKEHSTLGTRGRVAVNSAGVQHESVVGAAIDGIDWYPSLIEGGVWNLYDVATVTADQIRNVTLTWDSINAGKPVAIARAAAEHDDTNFIKYPLGNPSSPPPPENQAVYRVTGPLLLDGTIFRFVSDLNPPPVAFAPETLSLEVARLDITTDLSIVPSSSSNAWNSAAVVLQVIANAPGNPPLSGAGNVEVIGCFWVANPTGTQEINVIFCDTLSNKFGGFVIAAGQTADLVDAYDNAFLGSPPTYSTVEALNVLGDVRIESGATLNTAGRKLYYTGTLTNAGAVDDIGNVVRVYARHYGDFDSDDDIDLYDYRTLRAAYSGAGLKTDDPKVDADGDNDVDADELEFFNDNLAAFGADSLCGGAPGFAPGGADHRQRRCYPSRAAKTPNWSARPSSGRRNT